MKKLMQLALLSALTLSQAYAADLDIKGSELKWKASTGAAGFKLGGHNGRIFFKDGKIDVEDGKLKGGEFTVDMDNFTVDDMSGTWAEKLKSHLKSGDFFHTDKYPTSKLKIKSVKGSKVTADLTINGKTNEVKFNYKKSGESFSGKLVFNRRKFDMHYNGDESLGDKFIHNDVELEFSVKEK